MELTKRKIFNPDGDDTKKSVVNANTTNLIQLNRIKYQDIYQIDKIMEDNFWLPEKIDVTGEKECFNNRLQPEEREVYEIIISFLTFLDSIQTTNIPSNLSAYFTASEIIAALTTQAFFEKIHVRSYQYLLNSIFDSDEKKDEVYNKYKVFKPLYERTLYVGGWYQRFQDEQTPEAFLQALFADYILEAIYFYNSFNFFYNLAYRNLMVGTKDVIRKINIDENLHVALYGKIIKHYIRENNLEGSYDILIEMVKEAVEKEIMFMNVVIGDKILGINSNTIENYTKSLANRRLTTFGISNIYSNVKDPYTHLKGLAGEGNQSKSKINFFESNPTNYNMSTVVGGWDKL